MKKTNKKFGKSVCKKKVNPTPSIIFFRGFLMTYNDIHAIDFRMTDSGWRLAASKIPQSKGVYVHFGNIKVKGIEYYIPLRVGQTKAKSGFYGRWIANSGSHRQAFRALKHNDYKYIAAYPNYAYFFDQLRDRDTVLVFVEISSEDQIRTVENTLIQSLNPVWELPQLKFQERFSKEKPFKDLLRMWLKQNEHQLIPKDPELDNQLQLYIKSQLPKNIAPFVQVKYRVQQSKHRNISQPLHMGNITIQSGDEYRMMSVSLMKEIVQKVGMVRRGSNPYRGTWYYPTLARGSKVLEEDGYLVADRMEEHIFTQMIKKYPLYGNPKDDFKWKEMTVADFKTIINSILRKNST